MGRLGAVGISPRVYHLVRSLRQRDQWVLLSTLLGSIGGSPYFNINTGYFDSNGNSVSNSVTSAGSVQNNYSRGKSLRSSDIGGIVSDTLAAGQLPLDTNGIYMVLTAGDVSVSGFGSSFCGYHSVETIGNSNVHYAFIGNPAPSQLPPLRPAGNQ